MVKFGHVAYVMQFTCVQFPNTLNLVQLTHIALHQLPTVCQFCDGEVTGSTSGHVTSSSSRMCVMNHNWSAMKQRLYLQSVAEISRHSVLSRDRIRQCGISSGSRHKDTDQCL